MSNNEGPFSNAICRLKNRFSSYTYLTTLVRSCYYNVFTTKQSSSIHLSMFPQYFCTVKEDDPMTNEVLTDCDNHVEDSDLMEE